MLAVKHALVCVGYSVLAVSHAPAFPNAHKARAYPELLIWSLPTRRPVRGDRFEPSKSAEPATDPVLFLGY